MIMTEAQGTEIIRLLRLLIEMQLSRSGADSDDVAFYTTETPRPLRVDDESWLQSWRRD